MPGTNRCHHETANKKERRKDLRQKMLKFSNNKKRRSKIYRIGRLICTERLGALPIADTPSEDVLHLHRHLLFGDLVLDDP
jgi:hypothetical protein